MHIQIQVFSVLKLYQTAYGKLNPNYYVVHFSALDQPTLLFHIRYSKNGAISTVVAIEH